MGLFSHVVQDQPDATPMLSVDDTQRSILWWKRLTKSILRRKNFQYSVALQRGQSLVLQFSVYQHDIGFSAYFNAQDVSVDHRLLPHSKNDSKVEVIELQPYKYVLSSLGHYNYLFTAPHDGCISLCWDNSYSYFTKYICRC